MNGEQLTRYSRHILLNEIGTEGQEKLLAASVLIVGAGGLGSPASMYLAAAGIGHLILADGDTVDATNLQRQILHDDQRIGWNKAVSGQATLMRINPGAHVKILNERLSETRLFEHVANVDAVLDCSDNFATRHAINRACVHHSKPLISGAVVRFDGQLSVFDTRQLDAPCYHCLFPETQAAEETRCATAGVFAPLAGIIGAAQAAEALKLISKAGQPMTGRLLLINTLDMQWRSVRIRRDPQCPVCKNRSALL